MTGTILSRILRSTRNQQLENKLSFSTVKKSQNNGRVIISCKRKPYNFYVNTYYSKLDEVPLASKGWNHLKSKGDYFTIHPFPDEFGKEMWPFGDIGVHPDLVSALNDCGIKKATSLQCQAIPIISKGHNVLLAAETGCGKTLAYLIPIVQSLSGRNKTEQMNSPRALIIVPNRELAYQIGEVAQNLTKSTGLTVKTVVGGRTKQLMMNPEFDNIDILVGTPGALGKLSTVGIFKLDNVSCTVLDEADTLIDDSFIDRMTSLLKRVTQSQIVLVSATLPKHLPDILAPIEENLQQVTSPKLHVPLLNITQKFLRITRSTKPGNLLTIMKQNKDPMLIFTNKNETCNWLAMFLRENGVPCANINGDMNFAIRIQQWNDFQRGHVNVLSSTDIGSRGLNTTQVKHVLNYDFPFYAADYIHRIGRTGRIGSPKSCLATNFVTSPLEVKLVQQIELAVRRSQALENVDGNITRVVQNKIMQKIRDSA